MAGIGDGGDLLKCSFCGKSQKQVKKLIAGPGVYICDECINLCQEIIEEERSKLPSPRPEPPPGREIESGTGKATWHEVSFHSRTVRQVDVSGDPEIAQLRLRSISKDPWEVQPVVLSESVQLDRADPVEYRVAVGGPQDWMRFRSDGSSLGAWRREVYFGDCGNEYPWPLEQLPPALAAVLLGPEGLISRLPAALESCPQQLHSRTVRQVDVSGDSEIVQLRIPLIPQGARLRMKDVGFRPSSFKEELRLDPAKRAFYRVRVCGGGAKSVKDPNQVIPSVSGERVVDFGNYEQPYVHRLEELPTAFAALLLGPDGLIARLLAASRESH